MQTKILLAAALAVSSALQAGAQTPVAVPQTPAPAGSNWQHVMALPTGTELHISARTRHALCILKSVDAETLTCDRDTGVGTTQIVFQRPEITVVKLARRSRSAVFGASAGAGAGALAGGIAGLHSNYFAVRGAFAMIFAFTGAFAGAPTGYFTDFTRSTIYRAP